jgi:hypothetical protein
MNRLGTALALGLAAVGALAVVSTGARATADAACRKWEVKIFPMKPEHEGALRAGKAAGPLALEEGWEPFGTAYLAVAARRCAG